ncbi:MAG: ribonuclease R, partial [Ruthenibacterium sp.]
MGLKENILAELAKKPRRMRELGSRFGDDKRLSRTVDELYREKKITCRQGLYTLCEDKAKNAVTCTLVKLGRSFGFAKPEDGSLDVFVPGRFLMGAMPGDVVSVSVFEHPRVEGSVEGEVVAVLEQNNRLVGTVDRDEMNRLVVIPDRCPNTPLVLQKGADGGAMPGDKVAVEITQRGAGHRE